MTQLEYTNIDHITAPMKHGNVIITAGMVNASTGEQIVGIFGCEDDARSSDADERALGAINYSQLSDDLQALADRNTENL